MVGRARIIPYSNLIAASGLLYGTTTGGGVAYSSYCENDGCGVIFSVNTAGKEHVLYRFMGAYSGDGAYPYAGLTALNGSLYGVTSAGGILHCESEAEAAPARYGTTYTSGANNAGTVFAF